jgi:hypothetical protein
MKEMEKSLKNDDPATLTPELQVARNAMLRSIERVKGANSQEELHRILEEEIVIQTKNKKDLQGLSK